MTLETSKDQPSVKDLRFKNVVQPSKAHLVSVLGTPIDPKQDYEEI